MTTARFLLLCFLLGSVAGYGQGTAPVFRYTTKTGAVTLPGQDPSHSGTTVIPTVLVPLRLEFEAKSTAGKLLTLDTAQDVPDIVRSPVFTAVSFENQGPTQYMDAMLRATAGATDGWHTLLGKPAVRPVTVKIPAGHGYVLTSKRTGTVLGMADVEYVQRAVFQQIPRQDGKLVIVVSRNTAYFAYGDATVCCSWGTHGVDQTTGNSFVLASFLGKTPQIVQQHDVQPLTGQLAEWVNNPLHDPLFHYSRNQPPSPGENVVPSWEYPSVGDARHHGCGGTSPAARYTLQSPLETNERSDLPAGPASVVHAHGRVWHLANTALIGWYTGSAGPYSFPSAGMLTAAAVTCSSGLATQATTKQPVSPATDALPAAATNGHKLIGYWTGSGPGGTYFRLRDVSPQWDVIIVAFANVNHAAPEGTMQMNVRPAGWGRPPLDVVQFKADIAWLKSQGRKVLISLGGGGETFTLSQEASIPNFVNSVTKVVEEYGFDGVDLDFESPSLVLDPGDTDFRHPKTASVVNLIAALRQLREHFGPGFMLSLVPEGTQIPAGYSGYGGQFGTYLPLLWGVRDILSFVDVQDYNTPPLEGLDGEIYQMGSVDYDAAMTELLLHGFQVGGSSGAFFPPVPADQVAVGYLVGATTPELVSGGMQYLITGKAPDQVTYKLRHPNGYPGMIGAMFWTIDADRSRDFSFSNQGGAAVARIPAGECANGEAVEQEVTCASFDKARVCAEIAVYHDPVCLWRIVLSGVYPYDGTSYRSA